VQETGPREKREAMLSASSPRQARRAHQYQETISCCRTDLLFQGSRTEGSAWTLQKRGVLQPHRMWDGDIAGRDIGNRPAISGLTFVVGQHRATATVGGSAERRLAPPPRVSCRRCRCCVPSSPSLAGRYDASRHCGGNDRRRPRCGCHPTSSPSRNDISAILLATVGVGGG